MNVRSVSVSVFDLVELICSRYVSVDVCCARMYSVMTLRLNMNECHQTVVLAYLDYLHQDVISLRYSICCAPFPDFTSFQCESRQSLQLMVFIDQEPH